MTAPQTIFGQSDALALKVVALLQARSDANLFCLTLTASRVFARQMDLDANAPHPIPGIGSPVDVQVFPGHDQADRVGVSGQYDDIYGVHVLLQQQVGAGTAAETQCALLMQLRSQVLEFLMSQAITTTNAVHNFTNSHVFAHRHGGKEGIYDLERLEQQHAFYSDVIFTYKAPGLRR